MRARSAVLGSGALLAVAVTLGGAFFLGDKHAVDSMTIQQVSADELGDAMKGDHFYSDYRHRTLVLRGSVAAVGRQGADELLTFRTASAYSTSCLLGPGAAALTTGTQVTVLAEGARAERRPHGVLLVGCVLAGAGGS